MELEIWQLWRLARRWWWLLVLGPIVGAVAAFVVSRGDTPDYTATAFLRINPSQVNSLIEFDELRNTDTLAATYRLLVWTPSVLTPVIEDLGLDEDIDSLGNKVATWPMPGTQLLRISVVDTDPELAAEIANAVAISLSQHVAAENAILNETIRAEIDNQLTATQAQISETTRQIAEIEFSRDPDSLATQLELQPLQTSLDQLQGVYSGLIQTVQSLDINAAVDSQQVTLAAPAEPPTTSDGTNPVLLTAFGAVAGFLVAAAVVSVISLLDRSVRSSTDFVELIGSPQFSVIPDDPSLRRSGEQVILLERPDSAAAEAIRLLRANVELAAGPDSLRLLGITSPGAAEGKSTVAANLAVALAQAGTPTVLIDADLRDPSLHSIFGASNDRGLATLLTDPKMAWRTASVPTSVPDLTLIPSGPVPANPADLLSQERFSNLLQEIGSSAEMVILDTPALRAGSDTLVIAPHVDGLVLIGRSGHTRLDAMQWAAGILRPAGTRIIGVVLNRESDPNPKYAGYAAETTPDRAPAPAMLNLEPDSNRT